MSESREKKRAKADAMAARITVVEDLASPLAFNVRRALADAYARGQLTVVGILEGLIYSSGDEDDLGSRLVTEVARLKRFLEETT